jgi:hypothetical protein
VIQPPLPNKAKLPLPIIAVGVLITGVFGIILLKLSSQPKTLPEPESLAETETSPALFVTSPVPTVIPSPSLKPLPTPVVVINHGVEEKPTLDWVAVEKADLRRATPVHLDLATIEYDSKNHKFLVKLSKPYERSKKYYESWISDNYPLIPSSEFILQLIP